MWFLPKFNHKNLLFQSKLIPKSAKLFTILQVPREFHIGIFIEDTTREDKLDLLTLVIGPKLQIICVETIWGIIIDLIFLRDLIHSRQEISYYMTGRSMEISPIFKGSLVTVRPVGAVGYELKSTTLQKFVKVVHVQNLYHYFKRDADIMQNNTSNEENGSSAENQDPAEDLQEISVTTELSSSRH
ncbi:hypothetical protein TNCT_245181 [Trichonephila clavata]|uniref:Uncharacterized protein n=1 Tax=Trichonephila clavata TaxID=2740835 RepID=A0A8X6HJV5_TRICU|nr:hypothetical protein TNCT_245181 [Trichonephila clavata]